MFSGEVCACASARVCAYVQTVGGAGTGDSEQGGTVGVGGGGVRQCINL